MCQNVSNEVLSAWLIFQVKSPTCSGVCVQEEWQKYTRASPPLSKDEGLKDTGHSMSIRSLILGANTVSVSHLIRYDSLLQNSTNTITKYHTYFITKCDRSLSLNASDFLLQNVTVLLQKAAIITNCDNFITNCDSAFIAKLINSLYIGNRKFQKGPREMQ